jgi:hypothetical protein
VVDHLAAPVVEQRVAGRLGDRPLAGDEHAPGQLRVAGLLDVAADGGHRDVVGVGVEVAADAHQRPRRRVEISSIRIRTSSACPTRRIDDRK